MTAHPAPFTRSILEHAAPFLAGLTVVDVFCGTGRIHRLQERLFDAPKDTWGVELEWEWAAMGEGRTMVGDATALPFRDGAFDACFTSPTYGTRMADVYTDHTERHTYTAGLGRLPSPGSSAVMQWGQPYRDLHVKAWTEVRRVVRPGGLFLLNISDHIRAGAVVEVCEWHRQTLAGLGFVEKETIPIPTPRQKHGQNGELRVECEELQVWVRAEEG